MSSNFFDEFYTIQKVQLKLLKTNLIISQNDYKSF
jgi:hypothetical protein